VWSNEHDKPSYAVGKLDYSLGILCIDSPADTLCHEPEGKTLAAKYRGSHRVLINFVYLLLQFTALFKAPARRGEKTGELFLLMVATAALFATFICMCGNTHAMNVVRHFYPDNTHVNTVQTVILVICAVVSILTAIAGFKMFPIILDIIDSFEVNSEGKIQHQEAYMIEAVEMIKESIVILSEQLVIIRGNDASKLFFGNQAVGTHVTDYIHPNDLHMFQDTISRVMGNYDFAPTTIELRIKREPSMISPLPRSCSPKSPTSKPRPHMHNLPVNAALVGAHSPINGRRRASTSSRIHSSTDEFSHRSMFAQSTPSSRSTHSVIAAAAAAHAASQAAANNIPRSRSSTASAVSTEDEYFVWIEVTLCKGARMTTGNEFEYDVKMVARNVDDRKKRAQYQSMIEGTEEKGRINESKLRYISCIAHDLKTPLQSFSFTLDLLSHTKLHPEQRDFLQQANVAVDLMKLTISQTMDIGKALTGAKLQPRRTTVYLGSVIQRVKVIM
jgi:hypothetical protein